MYVVTVEFEIRPDQLHAFLPLMLENARASRQREPGCQQFDVCTDPARPTYVFLYEVYDSRSAFDDHRASAHFTRFDQAVQGMIAAKTVRTMTRV
jgi:(4S)-4-hydroxy-5-phosphonooxypentane-2,3-dione isomerase